MPAAYTVGKRVWSRPPSKRSTHECPAECAVLAPATSGKHHAGGPGGGWYD